MRGFGLAATRDDSLFFNGNFFADISNTVVGWADGPKMGYGFDISIGGRSLLLGRPYSVS